VTHLSSANLKFICVFGGEAIRLILTRVSRLTKNVAGIPDIDSLGFEPALRGVPLEA
jgi:hypothetical protein